MNAYVFVPDIHMFALVHQKNNSFHTLVTKILRVVSIDFPNISREYRRIFKSMFVRYKNSLYFISPFRSSVWTTSTDFVKLSEGRVSRKIINKLNTHIQSSMSIGRWQENMGSFAIGAAIGVAGTNHFKRTHAKSVKSTPSTQFKKNILTWKNNSCYIDVVIMCIFATSTYTSREILNRNPSTLTDHDFENPPDAKQFHENLKHIVSYIRNKDQTEGITACPIRTGKFSDRSLGSSYDFLKWLFLLYRIDYCTMKVEHVYTDPSNLPSQLTEPYETLFESHLPFFLIDPEYFVVHKECNLIAKNYNYKEYGRQRSRS